MTINLSAGMELVAMAQNGMFSDRYGRPSYDALIEKKTSRFGGEYIIARAFNPEEGDWGSGEYYTDWVTASKKWIERMQENLF